MFYSFSFLSLIIIIPLIILFIVLSKRSGKKGLLKDISKKINTGEVTREEIINQIDNSSLQEKKQKKPFLGNFLYVIGGVIILAGTSGFIAQIWDSIDILARITVSLGFGLLVAFMGSLLYIKKPKNIIGSVFHIIGGLIIPLGIVITLYELYEVGILISNFGIAFAFALSFLFYLIISFGHKKFILTLFSVLHGTIFVYSLFWAIVEDMHLDHFSFYTYLTMIVGVSYFLLARFFQDSWNKKLAEILYFLSPIIFLGGAFSLTTITTSWELIYYLIILAVAFFSLYIKKYIFLIISAIYFIIYSFYVSIEFFDHFLSHVLLIMLVGLGYLAISYFYQKYLNREIIYFLHLVGAGAFLLFPFLKIIDSIPWQLAYFFILFGTFFFSIYLKSTIVLAINTIFLIAYISYLTATHFANSLGWPISLVVLGFLFIGLAFASFKFNKEYIKEKNTEN